MLLLWDIFFGNHLNRKDMYYMTTLNFIYSPLERGRGVSGIAHPKHTPAPLKRGIDTIKSKLVM